MFATFSPTETPKSRILPTVVGADGEGPAESGWYCISSFASRASKPHLLNSWPRTGPPWKACCSSPVRDVNGLTALVSAVSV